MSPQDHSWWLLSRSAGIVALVLVAASTLMGLVLANGLVKSPQARKSITTFHEQTANAGLAAIGLHGVTLLGDAFLHPSITQLLIPFTIDYRPVYVGLGILGGYAAALLGLSFYARKRIGGKRWRKLHRATPVVYVLGLIHTLGAGTDAGSSWLRAFMLSTAIASAALLAARVRKLKATESPGTRAARKEPAQS
jgi:methionine sulfoxide reductase heme-binding subunit